MGERHTSSPTRLPWGLGTREVGLIAREFHTERRAAWERGRPHLQRVWVDVDGAFAGAVYEGLEEGDAGGILGLLVEFQVEHKLGELAEGGRVVGAELLGRGYHLPLADLEPLVVPLQQNLLHFGANPI